MDALLEILRAVDGVLALGIAIWIISIGVQRMDRLQEQANQFVQQVMNQQQQNNRQLMDLVKDLCNPGATASPK